MSEVTGNKTKKHKKHRKGLVITVLVTIFVALALVIQIGRVWQKKTSYAAEEKRLEKEKEELEDKKDDLDAYEKYTQTDEYTEDQARQKLGMVHENETIFREKK